MSTSANRIKRWVANHEAVNARVSVARRVLTPAESLRKAMQVIELNSQLSGRAPSSTEEALLVHRTWAKLRSKLLATQ